MHSSKFASINRTAQSNSLPYAEARQYAFKYMLGSPLQRNLYPVRDQFEPQSEEYTRSRYNRDDGFRYSLPVYEDDSYLQVNLYFYTHSSYQDKTEGISSEDHQTFPGRDDNMEKLLTQILEKLSLKEQEKPKDASVILRDFWSFPSTTILFWLIIVIIVLFGFLVLESVQRLIIRGINKKQK